MIEKIIYNDNLHVIVFDEPIPEYYELVLKAAGDQHKLSRNYRTHILKDMEFMTIWVYNNQPAILYGIQRDDKLAINIARVFSRYFIDPGLRSNKAQHTTLNTNSLDFYYNHPEFHVDRNIDTLFFTRNVNGKSKDRFLVNHFSNIGFSRIETPKMYKHVPQYFFVNGDTKFLSAIPDYIE